MIFSKSFGYAVRGVLYITLMQDSKRFVQAEEIAAQLAVPRHFVSKILKKLAKRGILASSKGKTGGFTVTDATATTSLAVLAELTDGTDLFGRCTLRLHACRAENPCPVHDQMTAIRRQLQDLLSATTVADLLRGDKENFIRSITTEN